MNHSAAFSYSAAMNRRDFIASVAVAPLAVSAVRSWHNTLATDWQAIHRRLVVRQQATCRQLAWLLRQPLAAAAAVAVCRAQPRIARRVISLVS